MSITHEYIRNPKNRMGIRLPEVESFMKEQGFFSAQVNNGLLWKHEEYRDISVSYSIGQAAIDPLAVKKICDAIDRLVERQEEIAKNSKRPLELPAEFKDDLKANLDDRGVRLCYKEFPEFSLVVEQRKFDPVTLTRSCRALERNFHNAVRKWQDISKEFGIEVLRSDGQLIFRQPALDIEARCTISSSSAFKDEVYNALATIEKDVVDMQDDRELDFMMLGEVQKYDVSSDNSCLFIRDPRRPQEGAIKVDTSFGALFSPETTSLLRELQDRYPDLKPALDDRVITLDTLIMPETREIPYRLVEIDEGRSGGGLAGPELTAASSVAGAQTNTQPKTVMAPELTQGSAVAVGFNAEPEVEDDETSGLVVVDKKAAGPGQMAGAQIIADPNVNSADTQTVEPGKGKEAATIAHPMAIVADARVAEPEQPAAAPQQPAEPELPSRARPGQVVLAKVPDRPQVDAEGYENTFGGRIVRHRNERNMTEQALADAICAMAKQPYPLDGDVIEAWQRNEAVPSRQEELEALSVILIDENDRIPDAEKMTARRDFQKRYRETKAALDRGERPVQEGSFGQSLSRYRRQRGMTEDALSDLVVEKVNVRPTEDLKSLSYKHIAKIQAGYQVPSPGFVNMMMDVFNNEPSGSSSYPLSEKDRRDLLSSYLEFQKEAARLDRLSGMGTVVGLSTPAGNRARAAKLT